MNENYKSELEKLYELMNQRKNDFDSLAKQVRKILRNIGLILFRTRNLEELMKEHPSKLEILIVRISPALITLNVCKEKLENCKTFHIVKKILTLYREQSKEQYKRQAERNSVELTRKNKELVDKIQELDILKMKYEEALANYQALNAKVIFKL